MRILITGLLVFIIWSLFSVWLFVNKIKPAMADEQVMIQQPISEPEPEMADSNEVQTPPKIPDDLVFYFGFDETKIQPSTQIENGLENLVSWLEANDKTTILITGHTDSKGTAVYNQKLGMRRATSTLQYLSKKGINTENISTTSEGEEQPVADNSTEEGRARNRRSVVTIKN